tara:strand:- start:10 stop:195 length:186 start_codon:yes stop_codon:yes gene_type:complete
MQYTLVKRTYKEMEDLTKDQVQLIIKSMTGYRNLNVSITSDAYKEIQQILKILNQLKYKLS